MHEQVLVERVAGRIVRVHAHARAVDDADAERDERTNSGAGVGCDDVVPRRDAQRDVDQRRRVAAQLDPIAIGVDLDRREVAGLLTDRGRLARINEPGPIDAGRAQEAKERGDRVDHGLRRVGDGRADGPDGRRRPIEVLAPPREFVQIDQRVQHHRDAAGHRAVVRRARADEQVGGVLGAVGEPVGVREQSIDVGCELCGGVGVSLGGVRLHPPASRQRRQGANHAGVVLERPGRVRVPQSAAPEQLALARHVIEHEDRGPLGGIHEARFVEKVAGLSERFDHQPVPRRDHLVVGDRGPARGAVVEQPPVDARKTGVECVRRQRHRPRDALGSVGQTQHVARLIVRVMRVAEVRAGVKPVHAGRERAVVVVKDRDHLVARPEIVEPFATIDLRVLGALERALVGRHLAQDIFGSPAGDLGVKGVVAGPGGPRVHECQERVVIEHLLEVRHGPRRVNAVAVEPAGELVADPSHRHAVERVGENRIDGCGGRVVGGRGAHVQQEQQVRGLGKLGGGSKPAVESVELLQEFRDGPLDMRRADGRRLAAGAQARPHRLGKPRGLLYHFLTLLAPRRRDRLDHVRERRHVHRVLGPGGEVRAAPERAQRVRIDEHAHRPPAVPRHELRRGHVDLVDVRALLAVHLDADEALIEHRGDVGVLEALALHHVAPVAGRVADTQEDRHVAAAGLGERVVAPREPVHRVVGVLEQVRAALVGQPILAHGATRPAPSGLTNMTPIRSSAMGAASSSC